MKENLIHILQQVYAYWHQMRNMLTNVKYIQQSYPHTQEFAKIDAVANICTQIAIEHKLEYGVDFGVGELGIDANGRAMG